MFFSRTIKHLLVCLLVIGLLAKTTGMVGFAQSARAHGDPSGLEVTSASACPGGGTQVNDETSMPGFETGKDVCNPRLDDPPYWRTKRSRGLNVKLILPPPVVGTTGVVPSLVGSQILHDHFPSSPPSRISETILLHRTVVLLV